MHGLVNRAIEEFARVTYGEPVWATAAAVAGVDPRGFELMGDYEDRVTACLLSSLAARLGRSTEEFAEDLGTWVAQRPSVRRLLRFAGSDFAAFMMTLEELRGRGQLVAPGLELPALAVTVTGQGWRVASDCHVLWLHAVAGMLHAMADDYGVLAVIEVADSGILVDVPVVDFNEARPFSISDPAVGAA